MLEAFFAVLTSFGPLGLFFISIISHATVLLPLPLDLALIPLASIDFFGLGIWTPLILGLIVALGAAIGEMSSYYIGFVGVKTYENMNKKQTSKLEALKDRLEKSGTLFIALLAFIPIPFDLVGVAAGLAKYSKKKFFVGCLLGKTPRFVLLAYAGYFGVPWILKLFGAA